MPASDRERPRTTSRSVWAPLIAATRASIEVSSNSHRQPATDPQTAAAFEPATSTSRAIANLTAGVIARQLAQIETARSFLRAVSPSPQLRTGRARHGALPRLGTTRSAAAAGRPAVAALVASAVAHHDRSTRVARRSVGLIQIRLPLLALRIGGLGSGRPRRLTGD